MNFILVAQGVPRLGTDLGDTIQVSIDIIRTFVFYVSHETLEAEGVNWREFRLFRSIEPFLVAGTGHGSQYPIPSGRKAGGEWKHAPHKGCSWSSGIRYGARPSTTDNNDTLVRTCRAARQGRIVAADDDRLRVCAALSTGGLGVSMAARKVVVELA